MSDDEDNFFWSVWERIFVASLSGSAVISTMPTRHLIASAVEIADAAVEQYAREMSKTYE